MNRQVIDLAINVLQTISVTHYVISLPHVWLPEMQLNYILIALVSQIFTKVERIKKLILLMMMMMNRWFIYYKIIQMYSTYNIYSRPTYYTYIFHQHNRRPWGEARKRKAHFTHWIVQLEWSVGPFLTHWIFYTGGLRESLPRGGLPGRAQPVY